MLFALLLVAGCSGIEPYEVRNHREEGPEQGVFTGSEGEFVIFSHGQAPKGEDAPESADESGWRDLEGGDESGWRDLESSPPKQP